MNIIMEKFAYQAKVGNHFFTDIVFVENYKSKKIYNATELHGRTGHSSGYTRDGYRAAKWIKEKVTGIVLEPEDFVEGIKVVKEIQDLTK